MNRDLPEASQLQTLLQKYHILAYPTEAVYGLGCHPDDEAAVQRILIWKNRPITKGFILIGSHWSQLKPYIEPVPSLAEARAFTTWPGPYTWLFPCKPWVPSWLRGDHKTLALRITAHPVAALLCERLGHALISTSANLNGYPPAQNQALLCQIFPSLQPVQIIPGAIGTQIQPTPIIDVLSGKVIRP